MSEKKSVFETKITCCTLCGDATDDFLELEDFSDSGFILCANCEAMSTSEDLYGANYDEEHASPRKSVSYSCFDSRIAKIVETNQENFQEAKKINAK